MYKKVIVIFLAVIYCGVVSSSNTVNIIPKPGRCEVKEGSCLLTENTVWVCTDEEATREGKRLYKLLGYNDFKLIEKKPSEDYIRFQKVKNLKPEAYRLSIHKKGVDIQASGKAGFFYAVQSLRQLLPENISISKKESYTLPCVDIEDEPRFAWRGMHMDFSRHFFDVNEVKSFLDNMALYKLNKYHMHLTDDQGWRIEIKKYPLLTEQGAWRQPSRHDIECNKRAIDDKLLVIDEDKFKVVNGKKLYGGFFTQEDIKEIIAYATERNIEVIPEIDVPGHFRAAMDQYPHFTCFGKSGQGISNANRSIPACLGNSEAYQFIKDILTEVGELFPSQYIHIGGDEVLTENWEVCPKCQKVVDEHHLESAHELQSYFNRDIEAFLKTKGKKVIGWDEIVLGGISESATMMWWRSFRKEGHEAVKKCIENGNEMVFAPLSPYYFDYGNGADPIENVYNKSANIIPEYVTKKQEKLIKGIQACLWAEYIPNNERLEYMTYPRMLALAETAWSPVKVQDYKDFNSRLQQHYPRMDARGINYALRKIEGIERKMLVIDSLSIELTTKEPNAALYYTLDGTVPTVLESNKYSQQFIIADNATINAIAVKNGKANKVYKATVIKQSYKEAIKDEAPFSGLQCWKFNTNKVDDSNICKYAPELVAKTIGKYSTKDGRDYALLYMGFIEVDKDGEYKFSASVRGDCHLFIDGFKVIENTRHDGIGSGYAPLKAGLHKVEIRFENVKSGWGANIKIQQPGGKKKETIDAIIKK
ncbi:MAG: family 20 glycosylhydrolase [Carboxylicivirga sp.]|jgi:hexosaminidase|nr:family 20 glycosylhydrolase [Carboxylicivirga sp.]